MIVNLVFKLAVKAKKTFLFTLYLLLLDAVSLDGIDQDDMLLKGKSSKRSDMFYNIDMEPMKLTGQAAVR